MVTLAMQSCEVSSWIKVLMREVASLCMMDRIYEIVELTGIA